jgi:hypothetical protein
MADFATTWPESGPSNAFVLLIFSDSFVVPRRHGRPEHQLTQAGPPTASNRIPGGNHSSQGQAGEFGKKRASRIPGGNPMRAFLLWG